MRFPPVDLGTGPWSKRTVASQTENSGPMTGAHRPRGSKGKVSLDNADAVIDGATWLVVLPGLRLGDLPSLLVGMAFGWCERLGWLSNPPLGLLVDRRS